MTTRDALIAEHGTREIPLERICERYFGLGPKVARERAARAELPVPAYKLARNGAWLVRADDLAALIDEQHAQAAPGRAARRATTARGRTLPTASAP